MTIEEAIKHCEEVANDRAGCCEDCAEEHRQLACWLKELKQYREQTDGDLISLDFMKKLGATCIAKRSETGEFVAISSIDNLPSAEKTQPQATDGDLISREIEKADFLMAKVKDFERTAIMVKYNTETIDRFIDYIRGVIVNAEKYHFVIGEKRKYALREKFKLPSAEKTAEWKPLDKEKAQYYMFGYLCSKCGAPAKSPTKYCPNCGARMGVEE